MLAFDRLAERIRGLREHCALLLQFPFSAFTASNLDRYALLQLDHDLTKAGILSAALVRRAGTVANSLALEPLDRGISGDNRLTKLLLLLSHFQLEIRLLLFERIETADIGPVGRAHEVRQHVHVAEDRAYEVIGCGRMGKDSPIGPGNISFSL